MQTKLNSTSRTDCHLIGVCIIKTNWYLCTIKMLLFESVSLLSLFTDLVQVPTKFNTLPLDLSLSVMIVWTSSLVVSFWVSVLHRSLQLWCNSLVKDCWHTESALNFWLWSEIKLYLVLKITTTSNTNWVNNYYPEQHVMLLLFWTDF